jgi:hypothetical protein
MNQNPYAPPVDVSLLDGSAAAGVAVVAWDEQRQVDALLARSLVFCYFWLLGFGSMYAVYCALKARRIIHQSEFALRGGRKSIVCLILGGIGSSFCILFCIAMLVAMIQKA